MTKQAKDPVKTVCGGTLKNPEKYPSVNYQDDQIYFCTNACLRVFKQNPEKFLAGEVEHPIHED